MARRFPTTLAPQYRKGSKTDYTVPRQGTPTDGRLKRRDRHEVLNRVRASVKMRDIYLVIDGVIPGELLQFLRDYFGRRLILRAFGEPLRNVLDAPLYKQAPLEMKPGDYLRFFRQDNNLSQSELGRKLGRLMENGRRPISRRMALRLSGHFGVSVDKFVAEEYPASGGSSDQP